MIFFFFFQYDYSNPGIDMLSYAVTAALQNTAHTDIRSLLQARIMQPLGIDDDEWMQALLGE